MKDKRVRSSKYGGHVITRLVSRVSCLAILSSCSSPSEQISREFLAMGTTVSITVVGQSTETTRKAIDAARAEVERIGHEWYPWSDGELARANTALAKGEAAEVSVELAALLKQAQTFNDQSDGNFDPAVGALVQMWGFDALERSMRSLPTQKHIDSWRANHPSFKDITIDGHTLRSSRRDVILDLGAIGKGYAVDRGIEILQRAGIGNAMLNIGGNLRAIGENDRRPWRIAIRDPRAVRAIAWLELRGDESVATSGDYERFYAVNGQRIHHLLDPRTGAPATHTMSVTVIANNATLADASSTALFVAGPDRWQQVARAMSIALVMRVDATGEIQVTKQLHERLSRSRSETRQTTWTVVDL